MNLPTVRRTANVVEIGQRYSQLSNVYQQLYGKENQARKFTPWSDPEQFSELVETCTVDDH